MIQHAQVIVAMLVALLLAVAAAEVFDTIEE